MGEAATAFPTPGGNGGSGIIGEAEFTFPAPGGNGGNGMMGEAATAFPTPGGNGGSGIIGEAEFTFPAPGGNGGSGMMGEAATAFPTPGGNGGRGMIGEDARLPVPGGNGGSGMMGEALACTAARMATNSPKTKTRVFIELAFMVVRSWREKMLCTARVTQIGQIGYHKSNHSCVFLVHSPVRTCGCSPDLAISPNCNLTAPASPILWPPRPAGIS